MGTTWFVQVRSYTHWASWESRRPITWSREPDRSKPEGRRPEVSLQGPKSRRGKRSFRRLLSGQVTAAVAPCLRPYWRLSQARSFRLFRLNYFSNSRRTTNYYLIWRLDPTGRKTNPFSWETWSTRRSCGTNPQPYFAPYLRPCRRFSQASSFQEQAPKYLTNPCLPTLDCKLFQDGGDQERRRRRCSAYHTQKPPSQEII